MCHQHFTNNNSVAFLLEIIVVWPYPMIWIYANEWSPFVHYTKQYLSALLSFCLSIHLSIFGSFAYFFYIRNYCTYLAIAYCLLPIAYCLLPIAIAHPYQTRLGHFARKSTSNQVFIHTSQHSISTNQRL